jgi:hypothetical protein
MFGGGVTTNIENTRNRKIDNMNRVTHFEIYTVDGKAMQPRRAKQVSSEVIMPDTNVKTKDEH